jgi:pimeloyl-ACP methyl ester carboxylesterase
VIHSYRHRDGVVEGDPRCADIQSKLAAQPIISVPTITLDGDADGVIPVTDGSAHAPRFSNRIAHRVIKNAGHNLPQEEPEAFAEAILDVYRRLNNHYR